MNLTAEILDKVRNSKEFPMFITNKDCNLISESAYICQCLEGEGYKVETYVSKQDGSYGIRIEE